uniref:Uncharacterized protein n=1 Tax=Setaria italica TaxID=4555 RepID=K3ZBU9_SETIT
MASKGKATFLILLMEEATSSKLIIMERVHSYRQLTADPTIPANRN